MLDQNLSSLVWPSFVLLGRSFVDKVDLLSLLHGSLPSTCGQCSPLLTEVHKHEEIYLLSHGRMVRLFFSRIWLARFKRQVKTANFFYFFFNLFFFWQWSCKERGAHRLRDASFKLLDLSGEIIRGFDQKGTWYPANRLMECFVARHGWRCFYHDVSSIQCSGEIIVEAEWYVL